MKTTTFTILLLVLCSFAYSQDYNSLSLLFARDGASGTARTAGSGNAYGSVGADLGSISINPAGLGFYRSSDICITPALQIMQNQANYVSTPTTSILARPYIGQGGVEFTKLFPQDPDHPRLLKSFTFALNYQSQNFYSRSQIFNAINPTHSMVGYYTAISNYYGYNYLPLEAQLLNGVGLMPYDSLNNTFSSNVNSPIQQHGDIETRGSASKLDMAFGGNISDKVYFGVELGLPILNYSMSESMTETNLNTTAAFQNYYLNSTATEQGIGFNSSLGLIYKPVNFLRLGVAYHLPTWYSINESYNSQISANYDTVYYPLQGLPQPYTDHYGLRTPMKGTVSASYFIKQNAFISVDYEFQNLRSSAFHSNDTTDFPVGYFDSVNAYNKSIFHYSQTVRVGFEAAINILRLRLGYSFTNSPYQHGQAPSGSTGMINTASCGLGVRLKNFYIDLAYVMGFTKDFNSDPNFNSYSLVSNGLLYTDQVNNNLITYNILLTLGWKFSKDSNSAAKHKQQQHASPPPVDFDQQQY